MNSHQDIIEHYRQADFEHRLSLFLECPALRDEFVRIDRKEGAERNSPNMVTKRKASRVKMFSRALDLIKS